MPLLESIVHSEAPPERRRSVAETPVWVAIRSLAPRHRDRIADHLLALSEHDRYLRFGHAASDAQIRRYVEALNFERDELLGIFSRRLRLLAMAHLAYPPEDELAAGASAEFGVSVAANARGRGYGKRLFDLAALHARNRGVHKLLIHALSENAPMLRIARHAGAVVVRDGAEAQALLELPADTLASQVEQMVETGAAEWDYRLKQQTRRMERLKRTLATLAARR
jgi:RimJ/RimL family protein N-acetyltransferase